MNFEYRGPIHLAQLLDDLLDISKIKAGKERLDVHLFDARNVVEKAIVAFRPVADTGPGIAPDEFGDLFKEFTQGRTGKARKDHRGDIPQGVPKGIGLGLYLSKDIVKLHGGRLWIESEPKKGTRISFTLPKHAPR